MKDNFTYIYPKSRQRHGDSDFSMANIGDGDTVLIVSGPDSELFHGEEKICDGAKHKLCPLTVENSKVLRKLFAFLNPVSHKNHDITIGLGDRLGLASGGHIKAVCDMDAFPVLAQQSMRELNLTNRKYDDVLASAVWAVFREGYTAGYGADGDHLKSHEDVKYAIDSGFSMITLDCSEHIPSDSSSGVSNAAEPEQVYRPAIEHIVSIYNDFIAGTNLDFEVSLDETQALTSPGAHLFVTKQLHNRGVNFTSLAPRFPGEFQKGIDYRGNLPEFEREFSAHAQIAKDFGYKLSIHSGSDKFSVFPSIGRLSGSKFHLKTAGTSWLEAVRVIALTRPSLYRQMHTFALAHLSEAKKYYHITEDVSKIPDITGLSDIELPGYMDADDSRQVLHITYGLLLCAKTSDGTSLFRDRIYETLRKHENEYEAALVKHIKRHLVELGLETK